jgi:hypothetical protein
MEAETIGEKSLALEYGKRSENFKGVISIITKVIVKTKTYPYFLNGRVKLPIGAIESTIE